MIWSHPACQVSAPVPMRLYAYQFQATQNFQSTLADQNIAVERCYRDTLDHRPQLSSLVEDCLQTPPEYVLVESAIALADDRQTLQFQLESFWACKVGVIAMYPQLCDGTPTPILLVPSDWTMPPPTLGTLPPIHQIEPDNWVTIGAMLQSHHKRHMIRQGHGRNRLHGLPPPGKAPYGYRRGKTSYLIDRRAAPVVKGFYEQFLLYGCLRRAVRFVEKQYGKSISPSTGKRWLTHPVYRGHLCYHQSDILFNTHPPLLTKLEAAQIDRLLQRNQRFSTRASSAPRALSGLVNCGSCGSGMTISQITKSKRQYLYLRPQKCPNQPKCSGLSYQKVLERTITTICDRLPNAIAALPPANDAKQALCNQIRSYEEVLEQIPNLITTGVLDEETAQLRIFKLKTELAQLNQKLASFSPVNLAETAQAIAIPEFWYDLSETERRFYLREFIHAIQIQRQGQEWEIVLDFVFSKGGQA